MQAIGSDPISIINHVLAERERLDAILDRALFDARMQGVFDEAVQLSGLSRTRAEAATRRVNESLGRQIRWTQR
jgi:hypothetical protein